MSKMNAHPSWSKVSKAKRMQRPKRAPSIGVRTRVVDSGLNCLVLSLDERSPMALALARIGRHPESVQATMRACRIDTRGRQVVIC